MMWRIIWKRAGRDRYAWLKNGKLRDKGYHPKGKAYWTELDEASVIEKVEELLSDPKLNSLHIEKPPPPRPRG